ncbi:uncharacterized protein isoform X2 [Musca autumnalis]|uniref:uncharacterized protein isoform X2 n=1 Tax=Musca autumnalis TaxID=221902 RepID=UPI003CED892D
MGNTITNRRKSRNSSSFTPSLFGGCKQSAERRGTKQRYELRSKTLPARNRKNKISKSNKNAAQTLPNLKLHYGVSAAAGLEQPGGSTSPTTPPPPNGETSRVLFLLYLIHRTWNVITDTKSKSSSSHAKVSEKPSNHDSFYETESNFSLSLSDLYEGGGTGDMTMGTTNDSQCCSQYSLCSCSSCYNNATDKNPNDIDNLALQNVYNSIDEEYSQDSIAEKRGSIFKRSSITQQSSYGAS